MPCPTSPPAFAVGFVGVFTTQRVPPPQPPTHQRPLYWRVAAAMMMIFGQTNVALAERIQTLHACGPAPRRAASP